MVKVGIIGVGTVGSSVALILEKNREIISARAGKEISVKLGVVKDKSRTHKDVNIPLSTNIDDVLDDPEIDIVVELMGGVEFPFEVAKKALKNKKHYVTANKAMLAYHRYELQECAGSLAFGYEASVAGGIPIIKALRSGLSANHVNSIRGIMNGTCNYILTKMINEGVSYEKVLKEAQELGYAEADPTLDIDGTDTVHKAAILASLAYGEWFGIKPIYKEGVDKISVNDIRFAYTLGYKLKLLAIIKQQNEDVQVRVHPALIRKNTMLANVSDVFNGVRIKGNPVGETLFYGRGAGRDATASAVVADIVDVCLNLKFGSHRRVPSFRIGRQFRHIIPMEEITTRYYLRINVFDKPGVIAAVSSVLGAKNISISSIFQTEDSQSNVTSLVILTHQAKEKLIWEAVSEIEKFNFVRQKLTLIRIEDLE